MFIRRRHHRAAKVKKRGTGRPKSHFQGGLPQWSCPPFYYLDILRAGSLMRRHACTPRLFSEEMVYGVELTGNDAPRLSYEAADDELDSVLPHEKQPGPTS